MTRDEVVQFFERQQQYWDARDAAALTAAHHEHGKLVSPLFRTVEGRPAILESYRALFTMFPDWTYQGDPVVVDGVRVAQPFHVQATHTGEFMGVPGTGRRVDIHGVRIFEMRDGL